MIVRDLSRSFNPCPKDGQKVEKSIKKIEKNNKKQLVTDFSIMPKSTRYSTKRTKKYCERHEAFFGRAYRNKSIKDGLILFLTEEDHRGTNGVHGKNGNRLNRHIKKLAQKAWMDHYHKTKEEFIQRYGENYL